MQTLRIVTNKGFAKYGICRLSYIGKKRFASLRTIAFVGSWGEIRTPDQVVNSHPLCQLSYPGRLLLSQKTLALVNERLMKIRCCPFDLFDLDPYFPGSCLLPLGYYYLENPIVHRCLGFFILDLEGQLDGA